MLDVLQVMHELVRFHQLRGVPSDALDAMQRAARFVGTWKGEAHPAYAAELRDVAALEESAGALADAERSYLRALSIFESAPGRRRDDVETTRGMLDAVRKKKRERAN